MHSSFSWLPGRFAQKRDAEFNRLADRYLRRSVFQVRPGGGTQLPASINTTRCWRSAARAEIDAQIAALKKFEGEVAAFDAQGLSPAAAADRELLLAQIRGQLLSLEVVRPWEKNPDIYSSGATNAIFVIMSRKFAPAAERAEERDRARKG